MAVTVSARREITGIIRRALASAQESGALPQTEVDDLSVERPQNPENGDFSCSLAMKLARPMRMNPRAIGQALIDHMGNMADSESGDAMSESALAGGLIGSLVGRVWLAGPGFVNFSLSESWLRSQVDAIIERGDRFGDSDSGGGSSVQVEFVSVNPTGPVHVGHARGAALGSALANILSAAGCRVQREYYVNDGGTQMELFYETVYARYLQESSISAEIPENGYHGEYMIDLARSIREDEGDRYLEMERGEGVRAIGETGLARMVVSIGASLERLGVRYDRWFRERELFDDGKFDSVMSLIERDGNLTDRDGARWFTATKFGEEKDAVIIRASGAPTYFASDIAYHYDKLVDRGFDRVIDIWGADHQGHVGRVKAAVSAVGADPDRLTLMIYQLVTFRQGEDTVRLSKRAGDIVTVDDLVDAVGADACRYFFLSRAADTQMVFDLELATRQSADNPVYYIQYAHARLASIIANAEGRGIDPGDGDTRLLTHEAELALIRKMLHLPEVVESIASSLEVHRLPHYAQELATAFHWFYQQCRVVSTVEGEEELTRARLRLCLAAKTALARCLSLMGMSAPERM